MEPKWFLNPRVTPPAVFFMIGMLTDKRHDQALQIGDR
jgi:hypothetical protein